MPSLAIEFISGQYQGVQYLIPTENEVLVGRADELDLVLPEGMVSRKHAKIDTAGDDVYISDLGSTNGTYVNGIKIRRTAIVENDRVLIGSSIFKVIAEENLKLGEDEATDRERLLERMEQASEENKERAKTDTGKLEDVPLADLLQLYSTDKRSGTLHIQGPSKARIYLSKGSVQYATFNDLPNLPPVKALHRAMGFASGVFVLEPTDGQISFPDLLTDSTSRLVTDALKELSQLEKLTEALPHLDSSVKLHEPLEAKLTRLDHTELTTLQEAIGSSSIQDAMDSSPMTDVRFMQVIQTLISGKYLSCTPPQS